MVNITLFSQIISKLDRSKFTKLISLNQTDKHITDGKKHIFIRLNIFVKINLQNWLDEPFEESPNLNPNQYVQGILF